MTILHLGVHSDQSVSIISFLVTIRRIVEDLAFAGLAMPITKLTPSFVRTLSCSAGKVDFFDVTLKGFMLEVRASGGKTYYQRYTDERGRERQFKIGPADVLTLQQARHKAKQIKAEAILGGDPQQDRQVRRSIPTLRCFVDERYLPFVKSYKRSWKTDETVLRVHILPELGRYFLDEIQPAFIIELTNKMCREEYASGTVGRIIVILRYIFNLAIKWKVIPPGTNATSGIPVPPDVQRSRYLSQEEAGRLLASIRADENQIAAKAIMLLFLTGARRNEVTQAEWSCVDWLKDTLLVRVSKNGQARHIQLNRPAIELLKSLPKTEGNPYIFPAPTTGRPMPHLFFPWDRIRKRAGLNDLRLHDLRHSFASFLVNKRKGLYVVQMLLGHKNYRTTQRYAHLSRETLVDGAEAVTDILNELSSL
jgi:integrase